MSDMLAPNKDNINKWIEEGKKNNNKYMLVICHYQVEGKYYYPVYAKSNEDLIRVIGEYDIGMTAIQEIYNLEIDIDEQLNKDRVWNT